MHSLSGTKNKKKDFRGAFSSAGLEHLPYKQRVGGSNPSTPTRRDLIPRFGSLAQLNRASDYGSEGYRFEYYTSHIKNVLGIFQSGQMGQTVNLLAFAFGGSNPSVPTIFEHFAEVAQLIEH